MENFARVIGVLDEYSIFNLMQNALEFKLEQSYRFHSCAGECYKFLLLTNKDRLQLFCYKPVFYYQCAE